MQTALLLKDAVVSPKKTADPDSVQQKVSHHGVFGHLPRHPFVYARETQPDLTSGAGLGLTWCSGKSRQILGRGDKAGVIGLPVFGVPPIDRIVF